ncbi:MAG: hypothetical protein FWB96_10635 [Defluviitaleaceae bacterium]|nr:hypothetical protein [Defluviitaleaceae bacterium]MCL2263344.1 hypothetical protein [Defluviitaleaceae bacterium]
MSAAVKKSILEQEYVYQADGSGDYCNVIVSLDVTEMEEIVTVRPQQNMTFAEVERVLLGFEADVLNMMDMQLEGSYPARLEYKNKIFKIAFDDQHNVKGIVPL